LRERVAVAAGQPGRPIITVAARFSVAVFFLRKLLYT
jgi:hypothetical protein